MSTSDIAAGLAGWLRENQQQDGRIRDPLHLECGTYASGFAALTFGILALRTGSRAWAEPCLRALKAARLRPPTSEFDHLALLLLAHEAKECQDRAVSSRAALPAGLEAGRIQLYRGRRLVSNNWVAMRALSFSLRARLTGSQTDREEAAQLWDRVLRWQCASGMFVDSPGGQSTPVTYHAKFCAMLALALDHSDLWRERLCSALQRGVQALAALVSPSGVLVPYGRSRNTLFGHAAAMLALRRGATLFDEPEYDVAASLLAARLRRFQSQDGHIPCVLNGGEVEKRDWDVYVNNPDYNAYAAAMLLLAAEDPECGSGSPRQCCRSAVARGTDGQPSVRHLGPILAARQGTMFAAFATHGQSVPVGTPFFCDHRYYGMQPLWIERDGEVLFEAAAYQWPDGRDRNALVDPADNHWLPYVAVDGLRYFVRQYGEVEIQTNDGIIEIEAEGRPELYRAVPRWERGLRRMLEHWTGDPSPVHRARHLDGVRLRRRLSWSFERGMLHASTEVVGALPRTAALHHGMMEWAARPEQRPLLAAASA